MIFGFFEFLQEVPGTAARELAYSRSYSPNLPRK